MVGESAAVDVEGSQDAQDGFDRQLPLDRPEDDLQVFLTGLEAVEDAVQENDVVPEFALQQAEVAAVEFDPELLALQVLQPARPQVSGPVVPHPPPDRVLAEVAAGLLALDPLVPGRF